MKFRVPGKQTKLKHKKIEKYATVVYYSVNIKIYSIHILRPHQ